MTQDKRQIPYARFRKTIQEDVLAATREYLGDDNWEIDGEKTPLNPSTVRMVNRTANRGIILSADVNEQKWWAEIDGESGVFKPEWNPEDAIRVVETYYERMRTDARERIAEATKEMDDAQNGINHVKALLAGLRKDA